MDREKYYEQILNAVDTGILVVDGHDNILQHNQAALRLLDTDVLTHMNQVKGKLKDEHLAKHETQAMLKDKHVRIIALSDVSHELSNQEVDSWIKLIRVLTHEIMNTITPVTSLSETLLTRVTEDKDLKQGLETIHKTGTELLAFVNNYRRTVREMNIIDDTYSINQQSLIEDEDSDRFEFAYDMKQLYRVIHSIPEDMKVPFQMFVAGFKYREIAEKLGLPMGTVKSRLFFIRKRLKEELKDFS